MSDEFIVYLPQSSNMDTLYYTENFFHYMNCVMHKDINLNNSDEKIDVYYAIFYNGQVKNGGHTQFALNTDNNKDIYRSALSGLRRIGAASQEKLLEDMVDLINSYPAEIEKTLNSPEFLVPPGFSDLDDRFFEADAAASIGQRASQWIERLPNLKIVSSQDYLAIVAKTNPH